MMRGGPFKLQNADPEAAATEKMKKEAIARVKSWVEARLPSEHLTNRDAVVGVSEMGDKSRCQQVLIESLTLHLCFLLFIHTHAHST